MSNISADNIHMLITAGAGFIGSYLLRKLLEEEYEVVCLDNFKEYKIYRVV